MNAKHRNCAFVSAVEATSCWLACARPPLIAKNAATFAEITWIQMQVRQTPENN
jgi:hypothetical protein